jgi:hypothetical protein
MAEQTSSIINFFNYKYEIIEAMVLSKILILALLLQGYVQAQKVTTVPKKLDDNIYIFLDVPQKIESGHGDTVKVFVSGKVSSYIWKDFIAQYKNNEKQAFSELVWILAYRAKSSLKNELSFTPLPKQFFIYKAEGFICDFKMMARNGYGNMVETESLITYNPFEKKNVDTVNVFKAPHLELKIDEK